MKVEFWGARGSIPSSYTGTTKYGGNTACVEIRTRSNDLIILDSGSGIRRLGARIVKGGALDLLEESVEFIVEGVMKELDLVKSDGLQALEGTKPYKQEIHLFLSHNHWDHIQGFPFFIPAYIPGYKIHIYSLLKADHRLFDIFDGQMGLTYFPVSLKDMKSEIIFHEITEETIRINDTLVTSRYLHHPQGCLGYRVTCGEMSVVYATDNEHPENGMNERLLELAENSDVLIYDSQYTPDEYPMKKYWGHSTYEEGIKIVNECGTKWFVMFHHDPEHDDVFVDRMVEDAKKLFPNTMAAYEGMTITDYPCEPTEMREDPVGEDGDAEKPVTFETIDNALVIKSAPTLLSLAQPDVHAKVGRSLEKGIRDFNIDCSGVIWKSRFGLIALADLTKILKQSKGHIRLTGMNTELAKAARFSRFDFVAKIEKPQT